MNDTRGGYLIAVTHQLTNDNHRHLGYGSSSKWPQYQRAVVDTTPTTARSATQSSTLVAQQRHRTATNRSMLIPDENRRIIKNRRTQQNASIQSAIYCRPTQPMHKGLKRCRTTCKKATYPHGNGEMRKSMQRTAQNISLLCSAVSQAMNRILSLCADRSLYGITSLSEAKLIRIRNVLSTTPKDYKFINRKYYYKWYTNTL